MHLASQIDVTSTFMECGQRTHADEWNASSTMRRVLQTPSRRLLSMGVRSFVASTPCKEPAARWRSDSLAIPPEYWTTGVDVRHGHTVSHDELAADDDVRDTL